jgi:hypothetical protein
MVMATKPVRFMNPVEPLGSTYTQPTAMRNQDTGQTLTAIAELKALQKKEPPQLRKIHPLDFPIEVFLADLTTRPAKYPPEQNLYW